MAFSFHLLMHIWWLSLSRTEMLQYCHSSIKDVRAHCYCASLVRTLFIRHARATSFSSACTKSKTQQNVELMTFALTWCANICVGCSVTPTFFRQITSFSDSFPHTKKQKKNLCVGSFNYFSYTIKKKGRIGTWIEVCVT